MEVVVRWKNGEVVYRQPIDPNDIQSLFDYTLDTFAELFIDVRKGVLISDETPEVAGMYAHVNSTGASSA